MSDHLPTPRPGWTSASGLRVETEAHGALRTLALDDVCINLFVANALEGGPANLVLRRHGEGVESTRLLGPDAPTHWHAAADRLDGQGSWQGLDYRIALRLAADAPAWFWHLEVTNTGTEAADIDVMQWQDLALAPYGAVRLNEYYVSQYVDHTPLQHAQHGTVLAARQNQPVGTRTPWCVIGSLNHAVSFATDALQVLDRAARGGWPAPALAAGLPGTRLQHEHSMAALQDGVTQLAPGATVALGFFGRVVADHPAATSAADLELVDQALALPEAQPPAWDDTARREPPAANLYGTSPLLAATELEEADLATLFGTERRHVERDPDGRLLSFFHGADAHVALHAKELLVLRPHGQILRTGRLGVPDERGLTSTAWMGGVFHSMLTQGHVSINRCLSTVRGYLGLFRSQGLRVFVEIGDGWQLLDQPSAFEVQPDRCRWIYRHAGGRIEVTSRALHDPHAMSLELVVAEGPALRCLVCLHMAYDGDDGSGLGRVPVTTDGRDVLLMPPSGSPLAQRFPKGRLRVVPDTGTRIERVGGDEALFIDGMSRDLPHVTLLTAAASALRITFRGEFVTDGPDIPLVDAPVLASTRLQAMHDSRDPRAERMQSVIDLMPWLAQNAEVHYLAPRGLEQFSGGGWGTRDVCQGPVEYLLAQGQHAAIRDLLLRVMKAQRPDGDWPQWFMFFERDAAIRAGDSHGDIVFWPLLALGQYLLASGDASILDERVPFHAGRGQAPTVWTHALRALALIRRRVITGTALAAYGHGDWNDALQPADPALREHMCSAWTVTLHHQALATLAQGLRRIGRNAAASRLTRETAAVRRDFDKFLLVDGVLCGYALFDPAGPDAPIQYLLHPRDATTGVHYSVLAMIHAILEGLLVPAQMREHLALIETHLSGPDGTRLFDRPLPYRGGPMRLFQRAESASYFGREIGLMYMHAHLRHAQALAHVGLAERFFRALCQASPIDLRALVASAARRPCNAYYSSSDAAFADRYQASAEYGRIADGTIGLEGGWRVYSSGAGILYGLVRRHLLGLRPEAGALVVDPVLPEYFDGLVVRLDLYGRELEVVYRVRAPGYGLTLATWNGTPLLFDTEPNPYRRGGARIALAQMPAAGTHRLELHIGE